MNQFDGLIDLSHTGLNAAKIAEISQRITYKETICALKLGFNDLGNEGCMLVTEFIRGCHSLRCLELGFNGIGDLGIKYLAEHLVTNCNISILYLSGNLISPVGFAILGEMLALNTSLDVLFLTGNVCRSQGATSFAAGLARNQSLKKLLVDGNKLGPEGIRSLSVAIVANQALTSINFGDNAIEDAGAMILADSLMFKRTIMELCLSFNGITTQGISSLCRALAGYHSLRSLSLDNNAIGDLGAQCIAAVIPFMSLWDLNLAFNGMEGDGFTELLDSLAANKSIISLTLSGNSMNNNACKVLANSLAVNSTLQMLFLDQTNISNTGEKYIAAGIATNKCCGLLKFTGFMLGKALTTLGSPLSLGELTNDATLKYLSDMWQVHKAAEAGKEAQLAERSFQSQLLVNPVSAPSFRGIGMPSAEAPSNLFSRKPVSRDFAIIETSIRDDENTQAVDDLLADSFIDFVPSSDADYDPLSFDDTKPFAGSLSSEALAIPSLEVITDKPSRKRSQSDVQLAESALAISATGTVSPIVQFNLAASKFTFPFEMTPRSTSAGLLNSAAAALCVGSMAIGAASVPVDAESTSAVSSAQEIAGLDQVTIKKITKKKSTPTGLFSELTDQFSPDVLLILRAGRELANKQFSPEELWQLQQYYFSPPQQLTYSKRQPGRKSARSGHSPSDDYDDSDSEFSTFDEFSARQLPAQSAAATPTIKVEASAASTTTASDGSSSSGYPFLGSRIRNRSNTSLSLRPRKKATNKSTMSRISIYPRVKGFIDRQRATLSEAKTLTLLRQLRFLEECLEAPQDMDLETLLLEEVFNRKA